MVMGLFHGPAGNQAFGEAPLLQGSRAGVFGSTWHPGVGYVARLARGSIKVCTDTACPIALGMATKGPIPAAPAWLSSSLGLLQ